MSLSRIRAILGAALVGAALLANLPARADELAAIDPQARTGAVGWRVDGITGEASAHQGAAAATPLAVGQVLSVGSEVQTGAGAVVFLSHNGDRLIVQPNSRLRIDPPGTSGLLDHFLQSVGSVFYDVEPRKNRSFGVKAPYVAAIVKGTRFLVTAEPRKNSVRVDRGRVLVESTDGVSSVLVDAGNLATAAPGLTPGVTLSSSGIPDIAPTPTTGALEVPASAQSGGTTASAVDAVGDTVNGVTSDVGGVVGGVSSAAGDVVGGTGKAVGNAAGAVANAVGSATGAVSNAVGGVTNAAGNVVGGVTNAAGNVVGGVANAVGGAVGGLLGGKR
jgi:hypothetical protein